jgi:hypothetical protein
MNTPDKNELLNDILGDAELNAIRDASLTRGLGAMHARARRRRQFQVVAIAAPLLLLALRWHFQPTQKVVLTSVANAPASTASEDGDKVKYINEKELLALFPGRPIALIGEPGHQRFILLDELNTTSQQ